MNILVLSCGTRNKLIQYFKRELKGSGLVMATDCSRLAPALYEADRQFIVPSISEPDYLDVILNICREHDIKGVFSLIDHELSLLAAHKQRFTEIGVTPVVSDFDTVEMCFNKFAMFEFLNGQGFKTIKSYLDKEKFYTELDAGAIAYPIFVKPVKGSASLNISKVASKDEIEVLFAKYGDLMIQEFMDGTEYGADCYIDLISGELVSIFTKEKILMRAGETDKAVSVKIARLFELIERFVRRTSLSGVIDIDLFERNGEFYISEVNPRFGGGYPHAFESGVNIPRMILNNLNGTANAKSVGAYEEGVYMMKYNEVCIFKNT
jgi:carbamoyl-phosphate synthase large subunit